MPRSDPTAGRVPCARKTCNGYGTPGQSYCRRCRDDLLNLRCPSCYGALEPHQTNYQRCSVCAKVWREPEPRWGRHAAPDAAPSPTPAPPADAPHSRAAAPPRANGATRSPYRSKLEADYAARLEAQRAAGEIHAWRYEPATLVIGAEDGTAAMRYCPDFLVLRVMGLRTYAVEFHEVKSRKHRGSARGLAKLHAAAAAYPWWTFCLVERVAGEWRISAVGIKRPQKEE